MTLEDRDSEQRWLVWLVEMALQVRQVRSQQKLADAAAIAPSILNAVLCGSRGASQTTRHRLALYFGDGEAGADELRALIQHAPPPPDKETLEELGRRFPWLEGVVYKPRFRGAWTLRHRRNAFLQLVLDHLAPQELGRTVIGASVPVEDYTARPDIYLMGENVVITLLVGLDVPKWQDRLEMAIGRAVVDAGLLEAQGILVIDEVPSDQLQDLLRRVLLGTAWLDGETIVGLDFKNHTVRQLREIS